MDEIDALMDALWNAAIDGDFEAAIFLQMFAPWAVSLEPRSGLQRGVADS
jgi:hypothetical protein